VQMRLLLASRAAFEQAIRRQPAGKQPLKLAFQCDRDGCALALTDDRPWFEPNRLVDSSDGPVAPDRRPLNLIRTLVDHFELADGGRTLILKVWRPAPEDEVRPSAVPFVNPVEVFPLQLDGSIDYDMTYQAIFRDVTDSTITILQRHGKAPRRACIGVYGAGRLYLLPVTLEQEGILSHGLHEAVFHIGRASTTGRLPKPRLDAPFADAEIVESVGRIVTEMEFSAQHGAHRRAHERIVFSDRPARLIGAPDRRPIFARDFSIGGMALITTFPLDLGTIQTIELIPTEGPSTQYRLRIVRCVPLLEDFYDVGGEFVDEGATSEGEAGRASASHSIG
jgi:hypothetical protein